MTKQELEQYRSIVAEIDEVRERLNNNIVSDTVVGSSRHYPFTSHVMRVEGIGDKAAAERDTELLAQLEARKRRIDIFIADIPLHKSYIRRAIKLYYIDGDDAPTWLEVAKKMYPKLSADKQWKMKNNLRIAVDRYLKK